MLSFGNISIKDMYYGSIKIGSAYLGSTKVYGSSASLYPYLTFEFSSSSFTPTTSLLNSNYRSICEWKQVSSSPNVWNLEIHDWYYEAQQNQSGIRILFSNSDSTGNGNLIPSNLGGGTCKLIGSGNFNVTLNNKVCQSFDRTFRYCDGLTSIVPIQCSTVINVGGMYDNCTEVTGGALDQYNWFNTYGVNITNHSGTFTDCGKRTLTGFAELNHIPVGWGGLMIPASTLMTSARGAWKNTYDIWTISAGNPDWTDMNGLYLFTEASVSSYAGVSMNRSRIAKFHSLNTSQGLAALYFYPCFMQHTSSVITWVVTTGSPNGSLTISQGNTDMPGTLDYSTYGPFVYEFGTYNSARTVYFCFFVTNDPISSSFNLSSSPYGVLYNSNFKSDAGLRYFF